MPAKIAYVYWDACVFLDYFNARPDRVKTLDDMLTEIANDTHRKIVTSVLSITETAFVQSEKSGAAPDPAIERKLDNFWNNDQIIELIDIHSILAFQARRYIRQAISEEYSLKAADAIHLASATWVGVDEFHTYDSRLEKYTAITGLTICQPYTPNPRLL
jgi:predicted nucleic acid-binding protein